MTKKNKSKKFGPYKLRQQIIRMMKKSPTKRYSARQILKKLKLNHNKTSVDAQLVYLSDKGLARRHEDGRYSWSSTEIQHRQNVVTGTIDVIRSGAAYLAVEQLEDDIYIPAKNLNAALDGDLVEAEVLTIGRRRKPEGRVTKVINHARSKFVGTLRRYGPKTIVQLGPKARYLEVRIDPNEVLNVDEDTQIIIEIKDWQLQNNQMSGKIVHVMDGTGNDSVMQGILIDKGFDIAFDQAILDSVEKMSGDITEEELSKRRDMREVLTFTIDPSDAKDFDDAISYRKLENGNYEIGIHIADVTHFVKEGSELDAEALRRSTSVYLVDRVCPMLPERLSNELCSLRPNEDKYCFSAVFEFDHNDSVLERWFGKTIIHSNQRYAYEEAQEVLDKGEGAFSDELQIINQLAKRLKSRRFKKGSIAFESKEVKFVLDADGLPIDVYTKVRQDAHMLIEDLMLLANREVAAHIAKKKTKPIPFVYRVHDIPDPDKVAELKDFAKEFGFEIKIDTPDQLAKSYNALVTSAAKNPKLELLASLAIRTMAKAVYQTENIGHYGLAFDYYTHFTSPIRRYADVLVHRILFENLETHHRVNLTNLESQCRHISSQERKAMEAERESIKYKQVEFLQERIGETFTGRISGMIELGIFVELMPSLSEGMVRFDRFNEKYVLSESRFRAFGVRTKKVYQIGDTVDVKLLGTDLEARQIELEMVPDNLDSH